MSKFTKVLSVALVLFALGLLVSVKHVYAQSGFIETGVTINKATNLEPAVFAGARSVPAVLGSNTKPFSLTLNFDGGPVSGADLNLDVYIVSKMKDGGMTKVATFNFNGNACTRRCYDQTIPVSSSKWAGAQAVSIGQSIKIPYDAAPGDYSVRVALRRGNTYAKFIPGQGVVEYNDAILESSLFPSYEVGLFTVVEPCVSNISSHYNFKTDSRYVENGYSGPEVSILQNILKRMGYYDRAINGSYDSYTASAAKKYQKSQGFVESGILTSPELNKINRYCDSQITPVITNLYPKKVISGDTITIEGKNFFSKGVEGKAVGTEITQGAEIISVTPTKITAKIYGTQLYGSGSFNKGIWLSNNGFGSNAMPIEFTWVGGTPGQPIIQKINGQLARPDQGAYIGQFGSKMVIEGRDLTVGNPSKVVFLSGSAKIVEAKIDTIKSTEVIVTVPDSLSPNGRYYVVLADSNDKQIGNNGVVFTAKKPVVNGYYKQSVLQGETIVFDVYNFNRNLELYLTDVGGKYDPLLVKPSSVVLSNLPAPYVPYARFTFALPKTIAAGKYNFVLKDGDGAESQISQKYELTIVAKDVTPPTIPGKPLATKVNDTTVRLNWSASKDSSGVEGYNVYLNDSKILSTQNNQVEVFAYFDFMPRLYTVSAYDKAGNVSAKSEPVLYQIPKPVLSSLSKYTLNKMEEFELVGTNLLFKDNLVGYVTIDPNEKGEGQNLTTTVRQGRLYAQVPRVTYGNHKIVVRTSVGVSNALSISVVPTAAELRATPEITSVTYDSIPTYGAEASTRYTKIDGKNLDKQAGYVRILSIKNEKGESIGYGLKSESPTSMVIYTGNLPEGKYSLLIENLGDIDNGYERRTSNTWFFQTKQRTVTTPAAPPVVTPTVPVTSPVAAPVTQAPTAVAVPVPVIDSVLPLSARANDTVTLRGSNFTGVKPDLVWVSNATGAASVDTLYQVSANTVVFKTPNLPAGNYNIELTANGGISNKVAFTVLPPLVQQPTTPYISSISPTSAKPNAQVSLTGLNFQGVISDLLFIEGSSGSISPEIISSSATSVVFKIPNMPPGQYKVYLFADAGESNKVDLTVLSALAERKGASLMANVIGWFVDLFR